MPRYLTRYRRMENRFTTIETSIENLTAGLKHLSDSLPDTIDARLGPYFTQLRHDLAHGSDDDAVVAEGGRYRRRFAADGAGGPHPRPQWQPRLEFPRFTDGDDPLAWIYKAEQFFAFYNTPEHQKVVTVSFNLEHEALQWFRWMNCLETTPRWEDFTRAFCTEFGLSEFDDSAETLFKLKQTGNLKDYFRDFRRLATRTREIGPELLKSCFLGGLKNELKFDVKLFKPQSVQDAIALAIQIDTKLAETKSHLLKPQPLLKHHPLAIMPSPSSTAIVPKIEPKLPTKFGDLPVKKLTPEEVQHRRSKGLCFYCDEKFTRGHRCNQKQLLMLEVNFDEEDTEFTDEELGDKSGGSDVSGELQNMALSECAFYGTEAKHSLKTMKVEGLMRNRSVKILLDSGSTHNFVDSRLVKRMGWMTQHTGDFEVMVADGGKVHSRGCLKTPLSMGTYIYDADLFSLPLGGCDVVLGIKWLASVSPILWDFQLQSAKCTMSMEVPKLAWATGCGQVGLLVLRQ